MAMNPYLDDDLQALAEHAQRFAQGAWPRVSGARPDPRARPRADARDGQMGFIAPELPEAVGGQGMGCLAAGVIHEEIAAPI
jgi:cyclohexanecarboxyl-CoA dehydrogenase